MPSTSQYTNHRVTAEVLLCFRDPVQYAAWHGVIIGAWVAWEAMASAAFLKHRQLRSFHTSTASVPRALGAAACWRWCTGRMWIRIPLDCACGSMANYLFRERQVLPMIVDWMEPIHELIAFGMTL